MLGAIANLWHNPESRIEVEDVQQHIMVSHPYKHSKCMVPWGLLKFARPFTLGHAAKQKIKIPSYLLQTFQVHGAMGASQVCPSFHDATRCEKQNPFKYSKCMVPWGLLRFARPFTLRHAAKKKKTKKHVPSHLLKDPPFPPLPIPLPLTHISLPFPTLLKSDDGGTITGDI